MLTPSSLPNRHFQSNSIIRGFLIFSICLGTLNSFAQEACCDGLTTISPPPAIVIDKLCCNETNTVDGSIFAAPPCPAGSTIQYSTDGTTFSNNLPIYDQTASITVSTRCDCDCSDDVSLVSSISTAPGESCCPDLSTPPTVNITNSTCNVFGGQLLGGSITFGTCPDGSSIMYSSDGITYSATAITYNQINPVDIYVRCECGNEIGQPSIITTIPGECPLCPDLSGIAIGDLNIGVTESTCDVFGGTPSGGVIEGLESSCPTGSALEYSIDSGTTWTTSLPTYNQTTALTVMTRCACLADDDMVSAISTVTTIPGECPNAYFGVTNNFEAADPCICNGDQGDNNQAGDGTFNETVTVTGPTGLMVRVATETNGAITSNTLMTESPAMSGSYILNFDHQDRLGFNITLFEWSSDGGATWTTATDASSTVVMISNVCAYPVLSSTLEPSTCNIYGGIDLVTVLSLNTAIDNPTPLYTPTIPAGLSFTIDGVAATILDPSSLAIGTHTLVTTYTYDNGLGDGGTSANPAIGLDNINCPVVYTQTFEIVECEPIPTMGEWGLIILGLLLLIFGVVTIKSRQVQQPIYNTKHV